MSDKMREAFSKWLVQRRLGRFADFDGNLIDCTAVFWEAWQAAKSVPVVGEVVAYDLSSDYVKLLEFLKAGNDAAGFVTTDDYHNGDVVGITRRGPYNIHIGCRGYSFASVYPFNSEDGSEEWVFIKACEFAGLKWIKPATSITSSELERLRKDAERYRWLSYNASYSIHEMLFGKPAFMTTHKESDLADCIDAAIQRAEANIAPDPYTGGAAPDPDMAHAAHCSDADCARCAAIDAAIAAEGEKE